MFKDTFDRALSESSPLVRSMTWFSHVNLLDLVVVQKGIWCLLLMIKTVLLHKKIWWGFCPWSGVVGPS